MLSSEVKSIPGQLLTYQNVLNLNFAVILDSNCLVIRLETHLLTRCVVLYEHLR